MVFIEISKRRVVPRECFSAPPVPLPGPVDLDMAQRPSCCEVHLLALTCGLCLQLVWYYSDLWCCFVLCCRLMDFRVSAALVQCA